MGNRRILKRSRGNIKMKTYAFALTKFGDMLSIEIGSFSKIQLDGRLSLYNALLSAKKRMSQESNYGYITFRHNDFRSALYYADKIENFSLEEFLLLESGNIVRFNDFLVYRF